MTLRPVLKGESILVAVEGGFARKPAPADGFAVDVGDSCAFLSAEDAEHAATILGAMRVGADGAAERRKRARR